MSACLTLARVSSGKPRPMVKFVTLGISIDLGAATAVHLIATGHRIDEQAIIATQAELVIGWGGLSQSSFSTHRRDCGGVTQARLARAT